jgi:hypothetical protein
MARDEAYIWPTLEIPRGDFLGDYHTHLFTLLTENMRVIICLPSFLMIRTTRIVWVTRSFAMIFDDVSIKFYLKKEIINLFDFR